MIITKIKQVGSSHKYYVYADEQFFAVFADIVLAEIKLKIGDELDLQELLKIKQKSDNILAFDMAIGYLSKFSKSKAGIKRYLKTKNFCNESIEYAIKKLEDYDYIDDHAFAENFVQINKNKYGKNMLRCKLLAEKVDENIINDVLAENLNFEEEQEKIKKIYEKYTKNMEKTQKNKQKTIRYLLGKGFLFDQIMSVLDDWGN